MKLPKAWSALGRAVRSSAVVRRIANPTPRDNELVPMVIALISLVVALLALFRP